MPVLSSLIARGSMTGWKHFQERAVTYAALLQLNLQLGLEVHVGQAL